MLLALCTSLVFACAPGQRGERDITNFRGSCYTFSPDEEFACVNKVSICDSSFAGIEDLETEERCKEKCRENHEHLEMEYNFDCRYVVGKGYGECLDYCSGLE
jgi:hypothetical protein